MYFKSNQSFLWFSTFRSLHPPVKTFRTIPSNLPFTRYSSNAPPVIITIVIEKRQASRQKSIDSLQRIGILRHRRWKTNYTRACNSKKQFHSRNEGQYYVALNALCSGGRLAPRFSPTITPRSLTPIPQYTPRSGFREFWNTFKLIGLISLIFLAICCYKAAALASIPSFLVTRITSVSRRERSTRIYVGIRRNT